MGCVQYVKDTILKANQHPFAKIVYIRSDGLLSSYHPDFMVCTADKTYIVETKGDNKVDDENVCRKQRATIEWCDKINALPADKRMGCEWIYVLLSEGVFYSYQNTGATIADICNIAKVQKPKENLFE
jgi:type III restriction enzyme